MWKIARYGNNFKSFSISSLFLLHRILSSLNWYSEMHIDFFSFSISYSSFIVRSLLISSSRLVFAGWPIYTLLLNMHYLHLCRKKLTFFPSYLLKRYGEFLELHIDQREEFHFAKNNAQFSTIFLKWYDL